MPVLLLKNSAMSAKVVGEAERLTKSLCNRSIKKKIYILISWHFLVRLAYWHMDAKVSADDHQEQVTVSVCGVITTYSALGWNHGYQHSQIQWEPFRISHIK